MTTAPDHHFPSLHRVHRTGWLNDPNGIMETGGRWHVYFQHNPASARHEQIRWGHVSSPDLVTWTEEPDGPAPRPGEVDQGGCWSGVGLLDRASDPAGVPTLVYSAVDGRADHLAPVVVSRLTDDLTGFTQRGRVVAEAPEDVELEGVRDPFVFEAFGRRWAIQGAGIREEGGVLPAILLYSCDDLERWEYLGPMLTGRDPVAAEHAEAEIWECPQLVRIGQEWVLLVSLWFREEIVPGSTTTVNHLIGALEQDEQGRPRFTPRTGGQVDLGPDLYAPQAVLDPRRDRVLLWGWAREGGQRTQEQTDAQGWSGCLTFPRELSLVDDQLLASAPAELERLRGERLELPGRGADRTADLASPARAEIHSAGRLRVELLGAQGAGEVIVEHTGSAATMFLDGSLLELLPDGAPPTTIRIYPAPGDRLSISGELREGWQLRTPGATGTGPRS
ncbi:MAG TPA: glycoside hydrolase family 32 protein [Candidatus Brachybacterium merdavium]|uniref:beta-fructofuranosidase n=1 Tax=Candidatus Brachybacterium merdavium TaxID=2838513 RepID=A0A9D2RNN4_9MICO|nr:glycoside hydrolase family 32 protein [Candidatus Brachybacterium merdavium]